jgi:hypothetical protein
MGRIGWRLGILSLRYFYWPAGESGAQCLGFAGGSHRVRTGDSFGDGLWASAWNSLLLAADGLLVWSDWRDSALLLSAVGATAGRRDKSGKMIHALPGMGANQRMYPAPWRALPDFVAHDWTPYAGEESLAEVAKTMCEQKGIRDGDILIGASLGGMVACEITKLRQIPRLILVGSAVRQEEINTLLAILRPFARVAPIEWLQFSAAKFPSDLAQMFSEGDASFMRAMCAAIFAWDGLGDSETKIYRIHGKHDLVIPPPPKADLLLDGGHLISLTHARECVEFIKRGGCSKNSPSSGVLG